MKKIFLFLFVITQKINGQVISGKVMYDNEVYDSLDSSYKLKNSSKLNFRGNIFYIQRINDKTKIEFGEPILTNGKPSKPMSPEDIAEMKKLVFKSNNSKMLFNYEKNTITILEIFNNSDYAVNDSLLNCTFKITFDTITINKIFCQKAIGLGNYSQWEFWFATNIPTQAGYFSFSGFPGLLVLAKNSSTKSRIKLTNLEYPSKEKYIPPFSNQKIYIRKEFEEFKKKENAKLVVGNKIEE